jgi:PEP-CTERM motif
MKLRATLLLLAPCAAVAGDFINLGFENPNLTHAQPNQYGEVGPTSEVLQGWSLTSDIGISDIARTVITAYRIGPASLTTAPVVARSQINFGQYGLFLAPPDQTSSPAYDLSQTGTIPANAAELVFDYSSSAPGFQVLVNGKSVPHTVSIYNGLGSADVSAYGGQTAKLEFVFPAGSYGLFDIAGFTTTPEPSTYALFCVGAVLLWWQTRRRAA